MYEYVRFLQLILLFTICRGVISQVKVFAKLNFQSFFFKSIIIVEVKEAIVNFEYVESFNI